MILRWLVLALVLLTIGFLLVPWLSHAAVIITPPSVTCAADTRMTSPVAGQDYCFDSTTRTLYAWSGTAWVSNAGVSSGLTNIKDFGALCDGATNDTAALAAALTAAAASATPVSIPPGNCLTDPFTVPTAVPALIGASSATSTITIRTASFSSNQRMIDARNNTKGLLIKGLAIAVNNAAFNATWTLDLTGSSNATADDLALTGSGANGIVFQGGTNIAVRNTRLTGTNGGFTVAVYGNSQVANAYQYTADNVTITGTHGYGIQFGGDGVRTSVAHRITNSRSDGSSGSSFAFSLVSCSFSLIEGNYVRNSNHEGFQLTDTLYSSILNNHGEWVGSNGIDYGISVIGSGAGLARFNKIQGNTLVNTNKEGIAVADWGQYTLVAANVLRDVGVRQGRAAMVAYTTTAGAQTVSNVFRGNLVVNEGGNLTNYFLEIQTGGGGALVNVNTVTDNTFRGGLTGAQSVLVGVGSVFAEND